ncbi:MAG: DegT/DnrJ/EryC1/StrS aminotransferase family protein, partial [Spirochaetes bacterium]|nr:DegT/DnrJ/EryC1/StrS aminotransferase family protein [Spirochaetota bacterium]
ESAKPLFQPTENTLQENLTRPLLLADCAHSFGAVYQDQKVGNQGDFNVFSFHAVKNLTTAEGGALTFNSLNQLSADFLYKKLALFSLHGQNKDALSKYQSNSWQYDIELCGFKNNMTDIQAAIGLAQLERYESCILPKRKEVEALYQKYFADTQKYTLHIQDSKVKISSAHLFPLRINHYQEDQRNQLMSCLLDQGISTNVHFTPIPLFSAYKKMGYKIEDTPEAIKKFQNIITCPLYPGLNEEDIYYISQKVEENL